ncbi:TetR family transcriptional regulator [Stenotrophomonas tumulicola]|uniref:TetR family transcriptional regulator n=1 Tax=Stenotrophomonas tumulicola TaxID=1685415 RepID=A0A7W3FK37_9GAMM|nr:TetR family transcriptional regulator [Stenotrophomonas tumulicola]MBA8680716.1 TetR family transcriptional regulator [Stenotrophomonas tumulicola]
MGRWEPDAESRFRAAAIELFGEIGYEQTTVAAIAERAGLTSRTFFRYFSDKREVLFNGTKPLQEAMLEALSQAPAEASPLEAITAALLKAGDFFDDDRRPFARQRSKVIAANAELRERELMKLATLSAMLAQALRERGASEPGASLAAEVGIAVFRTAFEQWVGDGERCDYGGKVHESLEQLRMLWAN